MRSVQSLPLMTAIRLTQRSGSDIVRRSCRLTWCPKRLSFVTRCPEPAPGRLIDNDCSAKGLWQPLKILNNYLYYGFLDAKKSGGDRRVRICRLPSRRTAARSRRQCESCRFRTRREREEQP